MKKVNGAEYEIMQYLWEREYVAFAELFLYFNNTKQKNWSKQTLNTNLLRLFTKGLIVKNKIGTKTVYSAAFTHQEYIQQCAKNILAEDYGGKLQNFLSALTGDEIITETDAEKLISLIQKY